MRFGDNGIAGIRLRHEDGRKWSVIGSKNGLFIPQVEPFGPYTLLVEGATDCAAALTLNLHAIGRPSCMGGVDYLKDWFSRNKSVKQTVIVSDLDDPGLKGAMRLQEHLPVPSAILVCPAKDIRTALLNGITGEMIRAMIRQLIWKQPN